MKPAPPVTSARIGAGMLDRGPMRVWVDLTNTAHVARPAPARRAARGGGPRGDAHRAPALAHRRAARGLGPPPHGARPPRRRRAGSARRAPPPARVPQLVALRRAAGASTARSRTARPTCRPPAALLRIPNTTMFDYEWARAPAPRQLPARQSRARARTRSRAERLAPLRRAAAEARPLPGPEGGVLPRRLRARPRRCSSELGVDRRRRRSASSAPRPRTRSTSAAPRTPLLPRLLRAPRPTSGAQTVVLARTAEQRDASATLGLERVIVPQRAVDGRSLVAFADLLVSAGGTMNREAAVLGTPVWSIFEGRLGRRGRAAGRGGPAALRCADPAELEIEKQAAGRLARARPARPRRAAAARPLPGSPSCRGAREGRARRPPRGSSAVSAGSRLKPSARRWRALRISSV